MEPSLLSVTVGETSGNRMGRGGTQEAPSLLALPLTCCDSGGLTQFLGSVSLMA